MVMPKINEKPMAVGRTAEVYAWEEGLVLKLFYDWVQPRWIEEEATITRTLHAAGLPVPWCGDLIEANDRQGILFERVSGITMLQAFHQKPYRLLGIITLLARLHVQMHKISIPEMAPQTAAVRWNLQHAPHITDEQRKLLLAQLEELPEGSSVCHNDFHPDNVMLTKRGAVIIDWMAAKSGNPMADVARTSLLINNGSPIGDIPGQRLLNVARRVAYGWYRLQYARLGHFDRQQFRRWLPIMAAARLNENIPGEQPWLLQLIENGLRQVEPKR
jgi:hypothetical protein